MNENFLALKNKYVKEKRELEEKIAGLEREKIDTKSANNNAHKKLQNLGEEFSRLERELEAIKEGVKAREREYTFQQAS